MAKKKSEGKGVIAQLQEAIRDSGKSLYQLSKESGVARPQISRFMRGQRTLTLPAVEKICEALRLSLTHEEGGAAEEGEAEGGQAEAPPTARKRKPK